LRTLKMSVMSKKRINLDAVSTNPPENLSKKEIQSEISRLGNQLAEIQHKLFAQEKYALLVILQGMDASGKDGAVRNVFSKVNPAGCRVKSFSVPTELEAKHDFLWRVHNVCPERGMIKVFNRSHYEDILVPTVQKYATPEQIDQRIQSINCFETLLIQNHTIVLKYFLHVSKDEQRERIQKRISEPTKRWKYEESDIHATNQRSEYINLYERIFEECTVVPWRIVPSDKKWYRNFYILSTLIEELNKYDIHYPKIKRDDMIGGF
jgi:PPK2 family polyphosphate:nucleotide phosphotransferase